MKAEGKSKRKRAEYKEGPTARENFEETMKSLFQVPKVVSKKRKKGKD
jgi:hypothetical protein